MSSTLLYRLALAIIVIGAFWVRTEDIARRPMHADEANQAVKTGELIESGHYAFDPRDHHGPTLYYAALPIAWLRGEETLTALTETTVRLVPAIAGTLSVLLLALSWSATSGRVSENLAATEANLPGLAAEASAKAEGQVPPARWTALVAAAFLAVSPPAVYYSRYFIQEPLLVTFTLGAFVCALRWWRSGGLTWAIGAGVALGLMLATKASAPLFVGAALIAALAAHVSRPAQTKPGFHLGIALAAAIAIAALFYASFGQNPAGLRDALSAYGQAWHRASDGAGHEKPWWYYLQLFGWQRNGGLIWQQLLFSALAVVGILIAFFQPDKFWRWTASYTLLIVTALSLTPYKTPWHAVHFVPGMAILAAYVVTAAPRIWLGGFLALVTLTAQYTQMRQVVFTRPADPRNPYAYVHSAPDVVKFRSLVQTALTSAPDGIVRVIGEEYWPLPWYLRGLPRIGYWSTPPDDCDGAVVIATGAQSAAVKEKLHGHYSENYLGLRPGVMAVVFTRQP